MGSQHASPGRAATRATSVTRYRNSELTLHRVAHRGSHAVTSSALPPEDTYVAIIQLGALPSHDYWESGRQYHQPAGKDGAIRMFHLSAEPSCRVTQPAENLHLYIPRAALDDLSDEADAPRIDHLRTAGGWMRHDRIVDGLKHSIAAALDNQGIGNRLFLDRAILALHTHLATVYGGMRPNDRRCTGGLAPWQERIAKELIADNLHKELSLAEIAQACKLSPAHFSRAFKVSTSMTPHAWLQSRRVESAKALLDRHQLSLAEIALACGFADQSHFTRVFSSLTGTTPGNWRRYRTAA